MKKVCFLNVSLFFNFNFFFPGKKSCDDKKPLKSCLADISNKNNLIEVGNLLNKLNQSSDVFEERLLRINRQIYLLKKHSHFFINKDQCHKNITKLENLKENNEKYKKAVQGKIAYYVRIYNKKNRTVTFSL
jgi:hypothetical protein